MPLNSYTSFFDDGVDTSSVDNTGSSRTPGSGAAGNFISTLGDVATGYLTSTNELKAAQIKANTDLAAARIRAQQGGRMTMYLPFVLGGLALIVVAWLFLRKG